MRVLFDQATPVPIRSHLQQHEVRAAAEEGWDRFRNGELLAAAEAAGFDVLLTTDKNIRYQQEFIEAESRSWFSANSNGQNSVPTCTWW